MADVSQFNVLGEIVSVKDSVARNVDISHSIVDILGDSNAYEFGNTGVLTDKYPEMTVHNRAVYGEGLINGFSRQVSEIDTVNPPDYVIIWIGNNDVRRGSLWGLPQLSVTGNADSFYAGTCFGELNRGLATIKSNCPRTKILGVLINKPSDLEWSKWRFFFGTLCEIYKKWNVPILNLNDCINFSNFVSTQYTTFYKDSLHYNELGCQRIRDILCSAMTTGEGCTGNVDYNDIYVETSENIEASPEKWIQYAGQFLQPFDGDPKRCSWSGTRTIFNLSNTAQRIICIGTWYGDVNADYFRFAGFYRTLSNTALHYYDTEINAANCFNTTMTAVQAGVDVLPLLRKGMSLSIAASLYNSCTNLPSGYSENYTAINIIPAISSTGFMMAIAWTWSNDIWIGNVSVSDTNISWKMVSSENSYAELVSGDVVNITTNTSIKLGEITIPSTGYYHIIGAVSIINDAGSAEGTVTLNNNEYTSATASISKGLYNCWVRTTIIDKFTEGQIVPISIYASAGSSVNRVIIKAHKISTML